MAEECPVVVNIRARPLNPRELAESAQPCISFFQKTNQVKFGNKFFTFDSVFDSDSTQREVYEDTVLPLLEKFMKGFNCCLMAYGQTGAGKTHTMGTEETKSSMHNEGSGIIPRFIRALFESIMNSPCPFSFKVSVSMLEIYQEDIVDLLSGSKDTLPIREAKGSVYVQGLTYTVVTGLEEAMGLLEQGCLARRKGATAMNASSSRSHAIFTLTLEKTAINDEDCGFVSKFQLVDLAGSERLKKTQAEGDRKKEGIKINEGLLAIGNVISALAEGQKHIPYRDAKITRILQDSLGGNSLTVMIACISPADTNAEETLSTLRYADRAKRIKNKASVNLDPQQAMVYELKQEILRLRQEITGYKEAGLVSGVVDKMEVRSVPAPGAPSASEEALRRTLEKLESQLTESAAEKLLLCSQVYKVEEEKERLVQSIKEVVQVVPEDEEMGGVVDANEKLDTIRKIVNVKESMDATSSEDAIPMECGDDGEGEEVDDDAFAENFVARQETLTREMEAILSQIRQKEKMVEETSANDAMFSQMKEKYTRDVSDLQSKIDSIQSERDKLAEQLKKISATSKISEERRKRLQELEKELTVSKKKMQEMRKLEVVKKQGEENMKRMRTEIEQLKQIRVQMSKQLRVESDKYRQWKLKHERELASLKNKQRKREMEAARTNQTHAQQLAVFKRKYEQATACTKRLQQQLLKGTVVKQEQLNDAKLGEQLKRFMEEELNLVAVTYEANMTCETLMEQRKELSKKLSRAKSRRTRLEGEPALKRFTWLSPFSPFGYQRRTASDRSHVDDEAERQAIDEEIENLNQEIEKCNDQIKELQTDCGVVDFEARIETRWSNVHTVAHAKTALKMLFEMASVDRKGTVDMQKQVDELKGELVDKREQLEAQMEDKAKLQEEMVKRNAERVSEVHTATYNLEHKFGFLLRNILDQCAMTMDQYRAIEEIYAKLTNVKEMGATMEKENRETTRRAARCSRGPQHGGGGGMTRSASVSQMKRINDMDEEAVIDGTRNRKGIQRYGEVKNTLEVIDSFREEHSDSISLPPTSAKPKKKKTFVPPSPIRGSPVHSMEPERPLLLPDSHRPLRVSSSPVKSANRRDTMVFSEAPILSSENNENAAAINTTFVTKKEDDAHNGTFLINHEDPDKLNAQFPSMLTGEGGKTRSRSQLPKMI